MAFARSWDKMADLKRQPVKLNMNNFLLSGLEHILACKPSNVEYFYLGLQ